MTWAATALGGLGRLTCSQAAVVLVDMLAAVSYKGNQANMHIRILLQCASAAQKHT